MPSELRSFFEYLRAYWHVTLNPASTRLVSSPSVPEGLAGRALGSKDARYLFASPDKSKSEGARDYAIILIRGRIAITRVLGQGFSIREVQMMSGHIDIRLLMKYDQGRENLEKNTINRLHYDD